jgi:RimJ/RimL family protein N-acetyltransferase
MSFVNLYRPTNTPYDTEEVYGPDPYDINFCLPLNLELLESQKVALTPFIPKLHAKAFWNEFGPVADDMMRLMPSHWPTFASFLNAAEHVRSDSCALLLVVLDKTRHDAIAGIIGLHDVSLAQLQMMLAALITLPSAQRTHVTTHAVALLLRYVLNIPAEGGIGLRRVVWRAHPDNARSIAVAKRFGFQDEGPVRWARVVDEGRTPGVSPRDGDPAPNKPGRHAVQFSLCCDDWEGSVKETVYRFLA